MDSLEETQEQTEKLSFLKGETFYTDVPYVTAIADDRLEDTCNWCFAHEFRSKVKCALCSEVVYCSDKCEDKDRVHHAFECILLQTQPFYDSQLERMALRAVARILHEQKSQSTSVGFFFGQRRTFDDLESNVEAMDKVEVETFQEIGEELNKLLSERGHHIPEDLIREVIPKLIVNGHLVSHVGFAYHTRLGKAVYLGASKAKNTCEFESDFLPLFEGNRMVFRALKDFSVSDPGELAFNYTTPMLPFDDRRKALREFFGFTCECNRCVGEAPNPEPFLGEVRDFLCEDFNAERMQAIKPALSKLSELPDDDIQKHIVYFKLFLSMRPESPQNTLALGSAVLNGCKYMPARLLILSVLCRDLSSFGANMKMNSSYSEFKHYHDMAVENYTLVYGKDHRLTQEVADLAYPRTCPFVG